MKRPVRIALLGVGAVATTASVALGVWLYRLPRADREVSNAADFDGRELPDAPRFHASDPRLIRKTAHEIQYQYTDEAGQPWSDTPYFIQLADGRYAFGYTDERGFTRAIFTDRKQEATVVWADEALARWFARSGHH
jgi:hypothetical protein